MAVRIAIGFLAAALAVGAASRAWNSLRHDLPVSWDYAVEARFEKMPPDDRALREWLRAQPGVVPHHVLAGRFEDGKLLCVRFTQSRNLAGQPPFPDLKGIVRTLGYAGADGQFRDSSDRTRALMADG